MHRAIPPIVEPIIIGRFYDREDYTEDVPTVFNPYSLHALLIYEKV